MKRAIRTAATSITLISTCPIIRLKKEPCRAKIIFTIKVEQAKPLEN